MWLILLSRSQYEILLQHAKNTVPNESCAVLIGESDTHHSGQDEQDQTQLKTVVIVRDVILLQNIDNSPASFSIDPQDLFNCYDKASRQSQSVVAIFHSHPNSAAFPSALDKKFMKINPIIWLIFSNIDNVVNAYRYDNFLETVNIEIKD
jgi:proteasome lid subunit RPN8/RPN11